jgi:hypothetical protein
MSVAHDPILEFFELQFTPVQAQYIAEPFLELAKRIEMKCPRNAERTVALRKLLESKDSAVRSVLIALKFIGGDPTFEPADAPKT